MGQSISNLGGQMRNIQTEQYTKPEKFLLPLYFILSITFTILLIFSKTEKINKKTNKLEKVSSFTLPNIIAVWIICAIIVGMYWIGQKFRMGTIEYACKIYPKNSNDYNNCVRTEINNYRQLDAINSLRRNRY